VEARRKEGEGGISGETSKRQRERGWGASGLAGSARETASTTEEEEERREQKGSRGQQQES
jgi:hypothetical protein